MSFRRTVSILTTGSHILRPLTFQPRAIQLSTINLTLLLFWNAFTRLFLWERLNGRS